MFTVDLESLGHVDWRLVRWTWLTHLFLRRCSFIEFISILKHCPSVHTLGIRRFNIEISLDDVHRVMDCKTVLVRETDELSKRMESLCIGEMTGEMCTQEHLASVVKVLLSFLTNLKSLRLVGCPWIRLETYIESMSCYREHLKLLKVHRSHLQHK
ncbi:hypothetical protein LPJ56_007102 [Coemansia sp. RSA 2599]|nr:hypothetical protein LPJ56_007102 [Coemansia sp. RSA 2599]